MSKAATRVTLGAAFAGMSMNLRVRLDGAGAFGTADLWQTPTDVTYAVLALPRWQDQARAYLAWVREQRAAELDGKSPAARLAAQRDVKHQRHAIGHLWRLAEKGGGRLVFYAA